MKKKTKEVMITPSLIGGLLQQGLCPSLGLELFNKRTVSDLKNDAVLVCRILDRCYLPNAVEFELARTTGSSCVVEKLMSRPIGDSLAELMLRRRLDWIYSTVAKRIGYIVKRYQTRVLKKIPIENRVVATAATGMGEDAVGYLLSSCLKSRKYRDSAWRLIINYALSEDQLEKLFATTIPSFAVSKLIEQPNLSNERLLEITRLKKGRITIGQAKSAVVVLQLRIQFVQEHIKRIQAALDEAFGMGITLEHGGRVRCPVDPRFDTGVPSTAFVSVKTLNGMLKEEKRMETTLKARLDSLVNRLFGPEKGK